MNELTPGARATLVADATTNKPVENVIRKDFNYYLPIRSSVNLIQDESEGRHNVLSV